ncbi:MAG: DUF4910 domain-containing protein [Chitinophagales bacterium]|nr:DUF4910 domain-containing protein [Chitinophagales bacterium]MDW8427766.1 DUF4910 domain-containing protein [Chitinophagales bacterium]
MRSWLLWLWPLWAAGQVPDMNVVRGHIDTLCSFQGRGYVDSADWRTAQFLVNYLRRVGLLPLANDYLQPFTVSVNTFPGPVQLCLNGQSMVAGKDFLVGPSSPTLEGKFRLQRIMLKNPDTSIQALVPILKKLRKGKPRLLLLDRSTFTDEQFDLLREVLQTGFLPVLGVLELRSGKLTWHVSQRQEKLPWLLIAEHAVAEWPRKVELNIQAVWKANYQTQNVVAYVPGTQVPDSFIVFTAHYDHLGCLGTQVCFPGANDNASGVAMLLQLAWWFQQHPGRYSVAFLFFGAEELGLLGSNHFVQNPPIPLDRIRFLINLDIVGTGDEGIKVVNATEFGETFRQLVLINEKLNALPSVQPRGSAENSDHYPFFQQGVHCFFIYTLGGITAYHDIYDKPETLPLTEFADLFWVLIHFTAMLSGFSVESKD